MLALALRSPLAQLYAAVGVLYWISIGINKNTKYYHGYAVLLKLKLIFCTSKTVMTI